MAKFTAMEKIQEARYKLLNDYPFFGYLAMYLKIHEDPKVVGTIGVAPNGDTPYNPTFINFLSPDHLKTVVAHEVMHLALDTTGRRQNRDHMLWNIASDYAINELLHEANLPIPEGGLYNSDYQGMCAEEIYDTFKKNVKKMPQPWCEPQDGEGKKGKGSAKDLKDAKQHAQAWKERLAEASIFAKKQGKLPAGMEGLVDATLEPQANWRAILYEFVTRSVPSDYSYKRPNNRRESADGFILPSMRSDSLNLVVAVDTSGSVSDKLLQVFLSEFNAIIAQFDNVKGTLITCDAEVHDVYELDGSPMPQISVHGRGGTDFVPVFDWVEKNASDTTALIYFTDMEGNYPSVAPNYAVLWATTRKASREAPFGQTLEILGEE